MGDGMVSLRGDVGLARFSVQAIVYGTVSLRGDVGLARFLLGAPWGWHGFSWGRCGLARFLLGAMWGQKNELLFNLNFFQTQFFFRGIFLVGIMQWGQKHKGAVGFEPKT